MLGHVSLQGHVSLIPNGGGGLKDTHMNINLIQTSFNPRLKNKKHPLLTLASPGDCAGGGHATVAAMYPTRVRCRV